MIAALTKRTRTGSLAPVATAKAINRFEREFSNKYVLIEINLAIVKLAMDLAQTHTLRGYDAVQLAAAWQANQERLALGGTSLTFISADHQLNAAANAEGLTVDNPNNHP